MSELVVIMGISGTGKSTLAKAFANSVGGVFVEADDFHSDQAKALMAKGQGIDEDMRNRWFKRLLTQVDSLLSNETPVVMAFSGLKQLHRNQLAQRADKVTGFFLNGDDSLIRQRLTERQRHFAGIELLDSQLAALQAVKTSELQWIIPIDIAQSLEQNLAAMIHCWQQRQQNRTSP
ncbi:gluconokinase [Paraferrimonas haliotis]|uniref:gluconokinase n=1 Tax=Paraferrimonas haliotis TaxID=2013866 RepID=A0AA37TVK9_9GAMM|nr:AAA family ATPase [Paraferrimonas haliotis]GLS83515.1 hypothetical protein GCM10007894_14920 [Paraferrimonas haliotis]